MTTAKYASLFPPVAPRWREVIHIHVHGAANLPLIENQQPQSYVTAQSRTLMATQEVGNIVNATNVIEGISPHWNEMIYIEISEDMNRSEDLILLILDKRYEAQLAEFRFPWKWFEPFYQYHLNLEYPSEQTGQRIHLYVSIMLKKSALSQENNRYYGLEALLNGFDVPITTAQSIYAVARIVPNYKSYKHDYLTNPDSTKLGIVFQRIVFASSEEFRLPEFSQMGFPQLSVASKALKLAVFRYDFFFTHPMDKDNMFTTRTPGLVIEFYPFHPISNNENWRITGLLGWVAVLLDARSYDALTSTTAADGLQTQGLIVESEGDLTADNAKYLTASLALRLIMERHPAKNLLFLNQELPILPSYQEQTTRQNNIDPVYRQAPGSTRTHLPYLPTIKPPRSATPPVANSPAPGPSAVGPPTYLPPQFYQPPRQEVQKVIVPVEQPTTNNNLRFRIPRVELYDLDDIPTEYRAMIGIHYPPRRDDDIDGWFDYFQRMVTVYKQAIRRLVQDVTQLRDQHKTLTAANQDLKAKITKFDQKRKALVDIFESDKLDKAKLNDIFNGMKAKIAAQALEIKENHIRLSNYEKELTRQGELRAQYDAVVRTMQAREAEMRLLKDRVAKADGLEETVRHQLVIIDRLEGIINTYMKRQRSGGTFSDTDLNFLREHATHRLANQQTQRRPLLETTDDWLLPTTTPRADGLK